MFHSATHEENKKTVLESLETESGTCRVVISTSALGMGIDMKGVRTVVHYGPPHTAEDYLQAIGRAGRDGGESHVVLLHSGALNRGTDMNIRQYLSKPDGCRRECLLALFECSVEQKDPLHSCCDLCSMRCSCQN